MSAKALTAKDLRRPTFAPGSAKEGDVFAFSSHQRAREALEFGLCMKDPGFNIFVLGPDRSGRMTATLEYLAEHLSCQPRPSDWVYLNNFRRRHRPKPYRLPAGTGRAFRDRMTLLVAQLREALGQAFTGDDYQKELRERSERLNREIQQQLEALANEARMHGLNLVQTPQGMVVAAQDAAGNPVALDTLPESERKSKQEKASDIGERLQEIHRHAAKLQGEFAKQMIELNQSVADHAVGALLDDVQSVYSGHRGLARWLTELRNDILENLQIFMPANPNQPPMAIEPPERRYAVNLLVDHGDNPVPNVVLEANPTYENLFGKIEYRPFQGGMDTDFSMIRAGALHRANGGILVLRAEALAQHLHSWTFLKGALRDGVIQLEELHRAQSVPIAGAPRPKAIPLDVKVVIVGSPHWYYTFFSADPEFQTYFKVKADIDANMDATAGNIKCYAGLIRSHVAAHDGMRCDDSAVVRLLGTASRWAAHRRKLTAQFELTRDVLTEAVQLARFAGETIITADIVLEALVQRRRRNARMEDGVHEQIADGTVMIDTTGKAIGQINGLTVRDVGDHRFGGPSRITARATPGREGVVNIERDVAMSGPIQQKGVMVLHGFIAGHFARRFPVSFNSSITFEQNYGGVEGDSASMAELLVVLSDLAAVPLRQDIAITGSVNQRGETQAVGGVQYKIEGFYRACQSSGALTGTQGVVIPAANAAHVILRDPVVEAVANGQFHVWAVKNIEEAIELFTGIKAGRQRADGGYPSDTVYGMVMEQLERFDQILKERASAS